MRVVPLRVCLLSSRCQPLRRTFLPTPPALTALPPSSTWSLFLLPHPLLFSHCPLPSFFPTILDRAALSWARRQGTWAHRLLRKFNFLLSPSRERHTDGARSVGCFGCQRIVPQKRRDADCSVRQRHPGSSCSFDQLCRLLKTANGEQAGARVAVHGKGGVAKGHYAVRSCRGNSSE